MKIKETKNENIKLVMNKEQASALLSLLMNLSMDDYLRITGDELDAYNLCDIWDRLLSNNHLL